MNERPQVRREFEDTHGPVVWPDPSPLSSWWVAVMSGDDVAVARSSGHAR